MKGRLNLFSDYFQEIKEWRIVFKSLIFVKMEVTGGFFK